MSQLRVLVVEDEQMMVEIIERVLVRKFAALVDLAGNGREGLQQAAEQTYSLILSDIRMPEMDGISMLERIRTGSGPNRATPVILLTGHHREGLSAASTLDARFMGKPFRRKELCNVVSELLAA